MNVDNVKFGPCRVRWDGDLIGHTQGGVEANYAPDLHEKTVDEYGSTPVGMHVIGEELTVTVPFAEWQLEKLGIAIPAGTQTASKITIGKKAGTDITSEGKQLHLHPIANELSDHSEDVLLHNAIANSEVGITYGNDGDRIYEVTFKGMIDTTKSNGNLIGTIGDYTA